MQPLRQNVTAARWGSKPKPERDAEICRRLRAGEKSDRIASDYGITGQRVRQIAKSAGIDAVAVRRQLRAQQNAEARAQREARRAMKKDAMLAELRALAHRLGRTPSKTDIDGADRNTIRDTGTYQRAFGSLRAAQEAAGLTPNASWRELYGDRGRYVKESAHAA